MPKSIFNCHSKICKSKFPLMTKDFIQGTQKEFCLLGHTIQYDSKILLKKKFRVGGIWPGPPTYPPHRVPQPLCILQIKQKRHCCLYTIPLSFFLLENITGNPPIVQGFDTTNLFTEKKSSLPSFLSFVPGCHHAWLSLSQHCWNVRQFLGGRWTLGRHGISWRRSFDWYCNSFKVSTYM